MSGLEGAAAAVTATAVPKLGGAIARQAALMVARRSSFRWLVTRRVAKSVEFTFPRGAYRSWLKTLTPREFSEPMDEVAGGLALDLDKVAGEKSGGWLGRPDHLSRALRLVEETFPAVAAELGERDYRHLTEQWAARRSSRVREQLLLAGSPNAALSSEDLSVALLRRSDARRAVRLLAFDLEAVEVETYLERIDVPEVAASSVRVLTGDFGAGKSEMAERWHRESVHSLSTGVTSTVPAWLQALDLRGRSLEQAIDEQFGISWRRGAGVDLVVDGLDETDPASAQAILDNARVLVRTFDNTRALLTVRPGAVPLQRREEIEAPLLSDDAAASLVVLTGAHQFSMLQWSDGLRATIQRPFFALAAGVMLARDEVPRGEADLIRALVEQSLQRGSERASVESAEIYSTLKKLAVGVTDGVSVNLAYRERNLALSSRLVARGKDEEITFSLPIFQQWFAAQAIVEGDVQPQLSVRDRATFDKWRWAAAVAVLSVRDESALDRMIASWVTGNAGAAGWILHRAFGANTRWDSRDEDPLDPTLSGARLLRAFRTWSDGLGAWARIVLPQPVGSGAFELGVTVEGRWIAFAFSRHTPAEDTATYLKDGLFPTRFDPAGRWRSFYTRTAPAGPAWPWLLVRDLLANSAGEGLASEPLLGDFDGVWGEEHRYAMALDLERRGALYRKPIPANSVREKGEQLLASIGSRGRAFIGSNHHSGQEIRQFLRWLDKTGESAISSPLPDADATSDHGRWIWDAFTEEGLKRFEVEVYGRACVAYDEALAHTFSSLGWSMPATRLGSMGLLLGFHYFGQSGDMSPGVSVIRVPMPLLRELAPTGPGVIWSRTGRAVISREPDEGQRSSAERREIVLQRMWEWVAERGVESAGFVSWSLTTADNMATQRPSVAIAAEWLHDDLVELGLATGMSPRVK